MASPNDAPSSPWYTRDEAAALLRVHITTLDRYVREGTVPAVKLGPRVVRIPARFIDDLLAGVQ